jgi:hypothetical protein
LGGDRKNKYNFHSYKSSRKRSIMLRTVITLENINSIVELINKKIKSSQLGISLSNPSRIGDEYGLINQWDLIDTRVKVCTKWIADRQTGELLFEIGDEILIEENNTSSLGVLREVTKQKIEQYVQGVVYSQSFGSKVHSFYQKKAERMYKILNPIGQSYWCQYLDSISPIKL